jgi:PAS domain S-box-containing protein
MSSLERLMLDQSADMIFLVEPKDLRILMANRTASKTLGYSDEALLAMTITEIESSLQDVFYWEDVRNGQYQNIDNQEGLYQCADTEMLAVVKTVRVVDYEGAALMVILAKDARDEQRVQDALEQEKMRR